MSKLTYTPANLRPAPVAIRQLDYDPATCTFSAEMSSLRGFGRVFNDSVDEGFTIIGNRQEIVFVVDDVQYSDDDNIMFWTLKSLTGSYTATIFND